MPAPFVENAVFFQLDGFRSLVKDQVTIGVWVHFWVFNSIPLIYMFVAVTVTCSVFCFFVCFVLFFPGRVSLYSPGCPGTHFVDLAGLKLRNLPASASQVLGLRCAPPLPSPTSLDKHKARDSETYRRESREKPQRYGYRGKIPKIEQQWLVL